jgi:hypothetical protein
MKIQIKQSLGAALIIGVAATTAFAGGFNYMFDAPNKVPYRWHLDHWPNGAVPVHTDLGGLGLMDNTTTTNWVIGALAQWNNVPTSSYKAQVVGTVADFGLGDITTANVAQVFPSHYNGGGITVVYDFDGHIFHDYLGFDPTTILGIALPEFVTPDTDEILEYTVFFNGFAQYFNDFDGKGFSGVFTHELGHCANLAHSQANGAIFNPNVQDAPGPFGCATLPYTGVPNRQQLETMYPFIDQRTVGTGEFQFTVDRLDDIAAISDLYPAPGWPQNYGAIQGTIKSLTKILGNGGGPTVQVGSVNVIARNVADPFNDFSSIVSGGLTRGTAGADGTFAFHGLTPGAQYVLYVDNLAAGAFPYPHLETLPGPEEWYNGALESGDGTTDDRCAWTPVPVAAGTTATADITFNRVKGAPTWELLPLSGVASAATADASVLVGTDLSLDGYWTWSEAGGYKTIGGFARPGGLPGISDDGSKIAGNIIDTDGVLKWGLYDVASQTWTGLPPSPTTPQNPKCNSLDFGIPMFGIVWGISGDGLTVVGTTVNNRSSIGSCRKTRASKWTAAGGTVVLPKGPPDINTNDSRAEGASYDGSVITGYDNTPSKSGTYWINGVEHWTQGTPVATLDNFRGEAVWITRDGSTVLGGTGYNGTTTGGAYKHYPATAENQTIGVFDSPFRIGSTAWRTDDTGNVIGGFDRDDRNVFSRIWTPQVGWADLETFLNAQGTFLDGPAIGIITAMSGDGTVWIGDGQISSGHVPYRVTIPKAIVCHKSPSNPTATPKNLDVTFPGGLADHLAHGDTLGLCQNGSD